MSDSEFPLTLDIPKPADARITVFDGYGRVVLGSVEESTTQTLPEGLYTVRTQRGADINDKLVRLRQAETVSFQPPPHYSAAPLSTTVSNHEYYAGPSESLSLEETSPPLGSDRQGCRLFLFIRAPSAVLYDGGPLAQNLYIRQAGDSGAVVPLDDDHPVQEGRKHGWLAYSVKATAGHYRLGGKSEDGWQEIPVHVIDGWQTQIFMSYRKKPLLDSTTIFFVSVHQGFRSNAKTLNTADLALQSLRSGSDWFPGGKIRLLLAEKFANPMLGLLGAHLLLRRQQRNPTDQRTELLETVLTNLRCMIGETPDLRALRLVVAGLRGESTPQEPFLETPMLGAGAEAVIAAAMTKPALIPPESVLARRAASMQQGLAWTTWHCDRPVHKGEITDLFGMGFQGIP